MKKLYCHTSLRNEVLEGASYDIVGETLDNYEIIDEKGYEHTFSKEPDEFGESYKTWFNLVVEPKPKEIKTNDMKTFILKVRQNGGEYHGYTKIEGKEIISVDGNTVVVDGVKISFDEYIVKIETKEAK